MKRFIRRAVVATAATAVFAGLAGAAAAELTLSQIVAKLESMGYTQLEDVEKERDGWEIEATAPNGTRVELKVDPVDGRVLSERPDDRRSRSATP